MTGRSDQSPADKYLATIKRNRSSGKVSLKASDARSKSSEPQMNGIPQGITGKGPAANPSVDVKPLAPWLQSTSPSKIVASQTSPSKKTPPTSPQPSVKPEPKAPAKWKQRRDTQKLQAISKSQSIESNPESKTTQETCPFGERATWTKKQAKENSSPQEDLNITPAERYRLACRKAVANSTPPLPRKSTRDEPASQSQRPATSMEETEAVIRGSQEPESETVESSKKHIEVAMSQVADGHEIGQSHIKDDDVGVQSNDTKHGNDGHDNPPLESPPRSTRPLEQNTDISTGESRDSGDLDVTAQVDEVPVVKTSIDQTPPQQLNVVVQTTEQIQVEKGPTGTAPVQTAPRENLSDAKRPAEVTPVLDANRPAEITPVLDANRPAEITPVLSAVGPWPDVDGHSIMVDSDDIEQGCSLPNTVDKPSSSINTTPIADAKPALEQNYVKKTSLKSTSTPTQVKPESLPNALISESSDHPTLMCESDDIEKNTDTTM